MKSSLALCLLALAAVAPFAVAQQSATQSAVLPALSALRPDIAAAAQSARENERRAEDAAAQARTVAAGAARSRGETVTNGVGAATTQRGDIYTGSFSNGAFDGYGIYNFVTGARFEGQFKAGAMEGYGIYYWPDGSHFAGGAGSVGQSAPGVHVLADGRRFEGMWVNDKRNGPGVEWTADGHVLRAGLWTDNQLTTPAQ
ncbi:MAG: hypothetical protein ABUL73_04395 [Alphaproteobacteria bacterium]